MTNESVSFQCFRCGKVFTVFGEQAKTIEELERLLYKFKYNNQATQTTVLNLVEDQVKCCNRPFILHMHGWGIK